MEIKQFVFNLLRENTYLIWDETKEAAIIDAGMQFNKEKEIIKEFIEENDLKLVAVYNTHLHLDHQFGNKFIYDTYGVKPIAGKDDEFLLGTIQEAAAKWGMPYNEEPQDLAGYITDNMVLKFGNTELQAFHTPGHSPGSYSLYNAKAGIIFTGDVLFNGSIGRSDFEMGNYNDLMASIQERLLVLPDETVVYSGHGPATTIGEERISNPFL